MLLTSTINKSIWNPKNIQITHNKIPKKKKRQRNEKHRKQKTNNKMIDLSPNIPIIILNVNGLNIPARR